MEKNLYHVQDGDRPMYVVGTSWQDALGAWRKCICVENNIDVSDEQPEPDGITLVCKDEQLIS